MDLATWNFFHNGTWLLLILAIAIGVLVQYWIIRAAVAGGMRSHAQWTAEQAKNAATAAPTAPKP